MDRWEISGAALELIKEFEGLRLNAYRDPVGIVTIGYGYTNGAGYGPGVQMGDTWTAQQAEDMLREGVMRFANNIQRHFTIKPNPDQFGAFVSLAYNIGWQSFIKSTALKRWNAGDAKGAAEAVTWWNKAGGKVLRGLTRRREAEAALILAEPPVGRVEPDTPREKPSQSTTVQASAVQIASGAGGAVAAVGALDGAAQLIAIGGCVLVVLLALWIMRERLRAWADGRR
jgi:lysozyme